MDAAATALVLDRIKRHEGLRLKAYYDSEGLPTQGWGHLLSPVVHAPLSLFPDISAAQADEWLSGDFSAAQDLVARLFPWADYLDDLRYGVFVEMAFQMGHRILGFRKMLDALEAGEFATAADEMLNSVWHRETPARAEELAAIMRTGQAPVADA